MKSEQFREQRYPLRAYAWCNDVEPSTHATQVEYILGFSQRDLREKPFLWHDAIHPDDLPRVDEAIAAFEVGKEIDLHCFFWISTASSLSTTLWVIRWEMRCCRR